MNKVPEDQTEKVCKKLHLERCIECCEGNHNPLSVYSREMDTKQYEEDWKSKMLLELIRNYYEPTYEVIKNLRASETEEEFYNSLKEKRRKQLKYNKLCMKLLNKRDLS